MDLIGDSQTHPTSVAEVVQLIKQFYQTSDAQEVTDVQNTLQAAQRSPAGWQLADALLANEDTNVQFFGALTFTVKLNSEWQILGENEIKELRDKLLGWLLHLVSTQAAPIVIRKLCSTLVVFYLHFPSYLTGCVRHLVCCLCDGITDPDKSVHCEPTEVLLKRTPYQRKAPILNFAAILVEELGKVDGRNIKNQGYHEKARTNEEEVVFLIADAINYQPDLSQVTKGGADTRLVEEGLKCFASWVSYALKASIDASISLDKLKQLTHIVLVWITEEDTFQSTCDLITDILTSHPRFLTEADMSSIGDILTSSWGMERFQAVATGDIDSDTLAFSRLVISFAEVEVSPILENPNAPRYQVLMQMMHGLLTCPGYPVAEDEYCTQTFEFWDSFVEKLLEWSETLEDAEDVRLQAGSAHAFQAVHEFWQKIRYPPTAVGATWNKDTKDGFISFRKDVADFMETAYPLFSVAMVEKFTSRVVSIGESPDWEDVESSLYCLNALSDCIGGQSLEFEMLSALFNSSLFVALSDLSQPIPLNVRQISVTLVGSYAEFFEKGAQYLPQVLNFLFTSITVPDIARGSSKSINSLCSSCRQALSNELPIFLRQYEIFNSQKDADDVTKERILAAIGFVVQGLPTEEEKLGPLTTLLGFIHSDAMAALAILTSGDVDNARELALISLRCLSAVGKAMQAPDDVSVAPPDVYTVWQSEKGLEIQQSILFLLQEMVTRFHENGEIIEACCCVLKSGFTESAPGPFVFPSSAVVDFMVARGINCSRIEYLVGIAATFVCSTPSDKYGPEVLKLLDFVLSLMESSEDSPADLGAAQASIEFLRRLLNSQPQILIGTVPEPRIEKALMFSIEALSYQEPLVKKAAAKFWSTILMVRIPDNPAAQAFYDNVVKACGPALVEKLLWGIGGGAARSELEALTEPLRRLVSRHPASKAWMTASLSKEGFPSEKLTPEQKRKFVDRIIMLRGAASHTVQAVKEFWQTARGSELFAY